MALTFDSALNDLLAQEPNKLAFSSLIRDSLGATRVLRCWRDPNPNAADASQTGTEFLRVNMTGALSIVSGNITGFGVAGDMPIRAAADLSTGASVLRIEGGGHMVQGSLGLTGGNTDFVLSASPTLTTGIGFTPAAAVNAPQFLASGVGVAAPARTLDMPQLIEVYDYTNSNAPVLMGTSQIDLRVDDFVYEDAELGADNGDIAVFRSSLTADFHDFEFAATLFLSDKSNTEGGTQHLQQVVVTCGKKKTGTWSTYPEFTAFNPATENTFPVAFKAVLKDGNTPANVLHVFQMQDGLPVNDQSLSQSYTATAPLRPKFHCFMALPWQNTRPRQSSIANKIYPGILANRLRRSTGMGSAAVLGCEPLITGGYAGNSRNGLNHVFAVPRWPQPGVHYTPNPADPYVQNWNEFNRSGASAENAPWATGWDYEPGSFSTHNWYSAPGGPRPDRGVIPSTLAMWMTYPTGARWQELAAWRDMADGFLMGYYNHANHHFSDIRTMTLAPNADLLGYKWQYAGNYYGDADNTGKKVIRINGAQRDGTNPGNYDNYGNMWLNGWARDYLHSYANRGWGGVLLNSPMHGAGSKLDLITQLLLNNVAHTDQDLKGVFSVRQHAWFMLPLVMSWKLASKHPTLGVSRGEIEAYLINHFEQLYTQIYVGAFVTNDPDPYYDGIRKLGSPFAGDGNGGYSTPGGGLGLYMGHVFQLMKQTGLWSVLYGKGGHIKLVLDMMIRNFNLYCIDRYLDAHCNGSTQYSRVTALPLPSNWTEYSTLYEAQDGSDLNHDANHVLVTRDIADCMVAQWPYILRDNFPEFPYPRTAAAIAKLEAVENEFRNQVAAQGTDTIAQSREDRYYVYPGIMIMNPPPAGQLGPQ